MQANSQLDLHQPFKKPRICETKQELCLQFKRGKCSYGENCIYSHDVVKNLPLNRPKRTIPEVGQWGQRPRMISSKMKLCWWSFHGKNCPYGEKCHFVHKDENSLKGISLDRSSDGGLKGVLWKTRLCYKWMRFGSCLYGANCHYAHGHGELRKLGSLTPPGSWMNASLVNALDTLPRNGTSSKPGIRYAYEREEQGKKSYFKWTEVEKISRVYADWIDHTPPFEVVSGKVES